MHRDALRLLGDFQLENVAAAALAAAWLGAPAHAAGLAFATAAPLPYRLQLLHTVGGVHVFDNSVSTEVESTRQASPSAGEHLLKVRERLDESLSSILILNTFAHTMGAAGVGAQAAAVFGKRWDPWRRLYPQLRAHVPGCPPWHAFPP